jgi:hypothetical protein
VGGYLSAVAWAGVLVFLVPIGGYIWLARRTGVRPTWRFGAMYLAFQAVWFVVALVIAALLWVLPSFTRGIVAAVAAFVVLLVVPGASIMARFALAAVRFGRLPVVATNFAAGFTYRLPTDAGYEVTPFDTHLFRTAEAAEAAGFHHLDPE